MVSKVLNSNLNVLLRPKTHCLPILNRIRGPRWYKRCQNALNWSEIAYLALELSIRCFDFSETLAESEDNWYEHVNTF